MLNANQRLKIINHSIILNQNYSTTLYIEEEDSLENSFDNGSQNSWNVRENIGLSTRLKRGKFTHLEIKYIKH